MRARNDVNIQASKFMPPRLFEFQTNRSLSLLEHWNCVESLGRAY
jgi:hypothetical protein